jgi:hypothetical protein
MNTFLQRASLFWRLISSVFKMVFDTTKDAGAIENAALYCEFIAEKHEHSALLRCESTIDGRPTGKHTTIAIVVTDLEESPSVRWALHDLLKTAESLSYRGSALRD